MTPLYVRPPPDVRRRIAHAAVHADMPLTLYSKKLIEQWRSNGEPVLAPVEGEYGSPRMIEVPLGEDTLAAVRLAAARMDISLSATASRIFAHYAPFVVETLVAEMTGEESGATR